MVNSSRNCWILNWFWPNLICDFSKINFPCVVDSNQKSTWIFGLFFRTLNMIRLRYIFPLPSPCLFYIFCRSSLSRPFHCQRLRLNWMTHVPFPLTEILLRTDFLFFSLSHLFMEPWLSVCTVLGWLRREKSPPGLTLFKKGNLREKKRRRKEAH